MTFGEKLIHLRRQKGITQEELAVAIGVSRQAISKWEKDIALPDTANLIPLRDFFDLSVDTLIDPQVEEMEKKMKKESTANQKFLIAGTALFILCLILSFVFQQLDGLGGSRYSEATTYLEVYPLNPIVIFSVILLLIGFWKTLQKRNRIQRLKDTIGI